MAKDDYFTIVCKILVYLYKRLKGKDDRDPSEYIVPRSKDFPITEDYMQYVIEHMTDHRLIENATIIKDWSGAVVRAEAGNMRITPEGIDYLRNNDTMHKVAATLTEAASIWSLFT